MTDIQTTLITAIKRLEKTSDSARLDAEVLLCHVLNKPRSHLRAWPEKILSDPDHMQFQALVDQRISGLPIAYITGNKEFWSRDFKISSDVLIPRPDTELLIELSLELIKNHKQARVIDLGTGSGIIAITLAAERTDLNVFATDISETALRIAKQNVVKHQIKNLQLIQSHWLDAIAPLKFDLIISNPPYIRKNDSHLSQGDVRFEPKSALIASDQGLSDIKVIANQARSFLKPGATLLIEHGYDQQTLVQTLFKVLQYTRITTHTDLAGNPRVTTGIWNPK